MSDMETIDRRLDLLEAENRALRSKICEFERGGVRKAVPAPPEPAVRISTPTPASTFPMPSAADLDRLLDAVGRTYPSLLSVEGSAFTGSDPERRRQYREQFEASFLAVGNMRRLARPSTKFYLSAHIQLAETILRRLGRPMSLRANPFVAAALAHHDVPVSGIGRMHEGIVVEVGLDEFNGTLATDAWRRILEGQAPREVAVSRRPVAANPVRVHAPGY